MTPKTDDGKVSQWRMKRIAIILLAMIMLPGCSLEERVKPGTKPAPAASLIMLHLADYPPDETPYHIQSGDFWLVHNPENRLLAFAPHSPEYADHISVDSCRFAWSAAVKRFVDPCSGDKWQISGRLDLENSAELWSSHDLDQYVVTLEDGVIHVDLEQKVLGASRVEAPTS